MQNDPLVNNKGGIITVTIAEPTQSTSNKQNLKLFNQGFFDIRDPADFVGVRQTDFSIAQIYELDKERNSMICEELYTHVFEKLKSGAVGKTSYKQVDYLDYQHQTHEPARRYILVEQETTRGTKMNVFVRFLSMGDNLYVAVDSYVIGSLDIVALILRIIFTIVPLGFVAFYLSISALLYSASLNYSRRDSLPDFGSIMCCIVPVLLFLILIWVDVVRAFREHGDLRLALRQNLHVIRDNQSFDRDDVLMFFKSSLPLVIFSVTEILDRNKLPVKTLENFAKDVDKTITINANNGGIVSIVSSSIGIRS